MTPARADAGQDAAAAAGDGQPRKLISVVSGCYNEEGNVEELYGRVVATLALFPQYSYEIIVADNCSTDGTRDMLRRIAAQDPGFKVILNSRNFGPIRSGYNAFLQATGDAVVLMSSDLQDPPELIADFIREWEAGYRVVTAIKKKSQEHALVFLVRRFYYGLLARLSDDTEIIRDFTGYGLYDRRVMEALKLYRDPDPYFRGFISEIGFERAEIEFVQPPRKRGRSKHGFFSLYGYAMTGFVNHSKLPLRLATFTGFCIAFGSLLVALGYLIYKILFWSSFEVGLAPLVIGVFFFSAVQLIFIGIIGEYVGAILTQVKDHPLAIEDERINFGETPVAERPEVAPREAAG